MSLFCLLYNSLSVLIYSISLGFCLMTYGKTKNQEMQYAGLLVFIYIAESVYESIQYLTDFKYSSHSLSLTTLLALTVVEIYILGQFLYTIFRKPIPSTFYIALCLIVIIGGLSSDWLREIYWCMNSTVLNISGLILCGLYWCFLELESNVAKYHHAARYRSVSLVMTVATLLAVFYIIASLCLFHTVFSEITVDFYTKALNLIISVWLIRFCQDELGCETVYEVEDMPDEIVLAQPCVPEEDQKSRVAAFCGQYNLTDREYEILHLILGGKNNQEISEELYITVGTVKAHAHSIFSKLDVSGRSQLTARFLNDQFNWL